MKKFAGRIMQKEESIIVAVEKLPAVARSGIRRNVYQRSKIWTLGNFLGNQEENTSDEGYRWVICVGFQVDGETVRRDIFFAKLALVGFGGMGFSLWGKLSLPNGRRKKG